MAVGAPNDSKMANLKTWASAVKSVWPFASRDNLVSHATVAAIADQAAGLCDHSDGELAVRADRLRDLAVSEGGLDDPQIIVAAFALAAESIRRTFGFNLYEVQLLAGLALSRGAIAEMQTGEGKTLTVAAPTVFYALAGKGVHVMTSNAYLAGRDYEQLLPCYRRLGLTAGLLADGDRPEVRREAYDCDITYGPGHEFGFDYLKDQTAMIEQGKAVLGATSRGILQGAAPAQQQRQTLQRGQAFAILDEIDSVLIDEANTPLILAGAPGAAADGGAAYRRADDIAEALQQGVDYSFDQTTRALQLTPQGQRAAPNVARSALAVTRPPGTSKVCAARSGSLGVQPINASTSASDSDRRVTASPRGRAALSAWTRAWPCRPTRGAARRESAAVRWRVRWRLRVRWARARPRPGEA